MSRLYLDAKNALSLLTDTMNSFSMPMPIELIHLAQGWVFYLISANIYIKTNNLARGSWFWLVIFLRNLLLSAFYWFFYAVAWIVVFKLNWFSFNILYLEVICLFYLLSFNPQSKKFVFNTILIFFYICLEAF